MPKIARTMGICSASALMLWAGVAYAANNYSLTGKTVLEVRAAHDKLTGVGVVLIKMTEQAGGHRPAISAPWNACTSYEYAAVPATAAAQPMVQTAMAALLSGRPVDFTVFANTPCILDPSSPSSQTYPELKMLALH